MPAKNWWFKFEYRIWRTAPELRRCSLETRAFWLEVLCVMHESDTEIVEGSYEEVGWLIGCAPEIVARCCIELQRTKTADVVLGNGEVSLTSRRLAREKKERISGKVRQAKFRENGGGDPERWTAIRAVILTRDGKRCAYCAKYATTVDHIIPRSKGGTHEENNLVAACKKCNFSKNNRTLEEAGMSFHATFNQMSLASNTQVTTQSKSKSNKKEIRSNKEDDSFGKNGKPSDVENAVYVGTVLAGITKSLGLKKLSLTQEREWTFAADLCFENGFTAAEFVDCFTELNTKHKYTILPKYVIDQLPAFVNKNGKPDSKPQWQTDRENCGKCNPDTGYILVGEKHEVCKHA